MLKVTKDGIKREGPVRKLSLEDREFIREMFEEFSEYQRPKLYLEEDYGDILDS